MSWELVLAAVGTIGALVIPFLMNAMRNQSEKIKTMEDRIYHMNGNTVTKQEFKDEMRQLEARISETLVPVREDIRTIKDILLTRHDR